MGDEIEKLGCGMPDGVSVGRAAGVEKVGVYGVATSQAATIADAVAATGGIGVTAADTAATACCSNADHAALVAIINTLLDDLSDMGIHASA